MYSFTQNIQQSQLCVYGFSRLRGMCVCVHETRDKQLNRATGK